MKNSELTIAVMIGSIRDRRRTIKPANALIKLLREKGAEPAVLDLQELDLPMFDDGIEHDGRTKLLETYKKMDGLIIVSPEYNHSMPSPVKNAIDFSREKELWEKPMTICSTSNGGWGGARMVGELRQAWMGIGGVAAPPFMHTPKIGDFDEQNPPEIWVESVNKFIEKSLRWFYIIKIGKAKYEEA